jgi:hypothetical protein
MSNKGDRFISKSEAAKRLDVHATSVNRIFARDGGPAPVRIGCRDKYRESDVEGYLKSKGAVL